MKHRKKYSTFIKIGNLIILLILLFCITSALDTQPAFADDPSQETEGTPGESGSGDEPQTEDDYPIIPLPEWTPSRQVTDTEHHQVIYDLQTKTEKTITSPIPMPLVGLDYSDGSTGEDGLGTEAGLEAVSFNTLSLVSNPDQFPWRMNVKLKIDWPNGAGGGCSGVLIDPNHILTAGHCIYSHDDGGWASSIEVIPGYDNGDEPYGDADALNLYSFTGWTQNENFEWDFGYIRLNRPVGALTGWFSYGWNNSNSYFTTTDFNNPGYPGDSYGGQRMYTWNGTFDDATTHIVTHDQPSIPGQSGSGNYAFVSSNNRRIFGVMSYRYDSDNNGTYDSAGVARITQGKFDSISDRVSTNTPSQVDLVSLDTNVSPSSITAGSQLSSMDYYLHNYSSTTWNGTVSIKVYLSTDDLISNSDTLLQTRNYSGSLGPKESIRVTASSGLPIIPIDKSGTYWIGIIADISDANTNNNDSSNWDAAQLVVSSFTPSVPTNVQASDGTYTDRVRVTWNSVSGATSYNVYRATSPGGFKSLLGNSTATSYNDYAASPGTTYYYFVRAKAANGNLSNYSGLNSGYRAISPPTNVQASDGTYTDKVRVTWNSVSGATSYTVYRATSTNGTKTTLGTTSSTGYDDTTASPGSIYYYFVKARVNAISSDYSSHNTGYRALIAPTNVQASDGAYPDKVAITWNSVSNATSYDVYRATAVNGNKSLLSNTSSTSYDDTTASPGTIYYYFIKAKVNSITSDFSNEDTGYSGLAAPSNVQASDGDYTDKIAITWDSIAEAVSYDLYRATSANGNKSLLDNVTGTTYDDTSATGGVTYYYFVKAKAVNDATSDFSSEDTGYRGLTPPVNVQASDGTYPDKVAITWNSVSDAVSYEIYRATSESGDKTMLGNPTGTSYDDTSAAADTTYYYFVKAKGANDSTSDFSDSDTGQLGPAGSPPTAPVNVQASDGTYPDKVIVTWDAVDDATSYTLHRADAPGGDTTELATITETSYEDTTVTQDVPYYYSVTAQNDFGTSDFSAEAMGQAMSQTANTVYLPLVIK